VKEEKHFSIHETRQLFSANAKQAFQLMQHELTLFIRSIQNSLYLWELWSLCSKAM